MTIDPTWFVIAFICAIFILGFLIGYILGRLEANKLFDLRDRNIYLKKRREYWEDRYDDQVRYTLELKEGHNQIVEKLLAKEDSGSEKTT